MSGEQNERTLESRVEKLEMLSAFAERTTEELSEEVRTLNSRVRELLKRLDGAERRIDAMAERLAGPESGS